MVWSVHRCLAVGIPVTLAAAGLAIVGTAASADLSAAPARVSGFVSGQVVSVKGAGFVVKSSFGAVADSTVSVTGASVITEQLSSTRSALVRGVCVTANGQKAASGAIDALRITVAPPVKGACSTGFSLHGGSTRSRSAAAAGPPSGSSGFGNFGFAAGKITGIKGDKLIVHGADGSSTVALSGSTEILETHAVGRSAIAVDACALVRGTSSDAGVKIKATSIDLSKPGASGCGHGFTHA